VTAEWEGLAGALAGVPELPGARCIGAWEIFDNEHGSAELQGYAINLCQSCPALTACRDWTRQLRPSQRPGGIIAGRTAKEQRALKETA
jgi:hypothetical protein